MYATQADLIRRFGSDRVLECSDRDNTGSIDAARVAGALVDASSEMDSFIAARYTLPMTQAAPMLASLCLDITWYRLQAERANEADTGMYDRAIKLLKQIADGSISIGPDSTAAAPATTVPMAVKSRAKVFGNLERY